MAIERSVGRQISKKRGLHSGRGLIWHLLSEPAHLYAIQTMPPEVLHRLIHHVGLEDAGELIEYLSTPQLEALFDDDLWSNEQPGWEEHFDASRFGLWLEVMAEVGPAFAARKLAALSEDLVVLGLHHVILVLDLDQILDQRTMASFHEPDDLFEKALESALYEEFDEYCVLAKEHETWDALLGVLLAWDELDHTTLHRILGRCAWFSMERLEALGDLFSLLEPEETLEADLAAAREARRVHVGYVPPSTARSFLRLFEVRTLEELSRVEERDPLTLAYFREYGGLDTSPVPGFSTSAQSVGEDGSRLLALLEDAGVIAEPPQAPVSLLPGHSEGEGVVEDWLLTALQSIATSAPAVLGQRQEELHYLANLLCAGVSLKGRRIRPVEAAQAAIATCQLGLEHLLTISSPKNHTTQDLQQLSRAARILETTHMEQVFLIGWSLLMWEVSFPAARSLLRQLELSSGEEKEEVMDLVKALHKALEGMRPWDVYEAWELRGVFAHEEHQAWSGLLSHMPFCQGELLEHTEERGSFRYIKSLSDCRRISVWFGKP